MRRLHFSFTNAKNVVVIRSCYEIEVAILIYVNVNDVRKKIYYIVPKKFSCMVVVVMTG